MQNTLKYLRVSVTDRCNLRCRYCETGILHKLPPGCILAFEEICRFISIAAGLGVETVRLTGGEPLVRSNVIDLFRMIKKIPGIKDLTFTTNGLLLKNFSRDLFEAGVRRFNVSIDTLNAKKFADLTGSDSLGMVIDGVKEARDMGFDPIKINAVILKGINDSEFCDFVEFAISNGFIIRFIELMNISDSPGFVKEHFMGAEEVKKIISSRYELLPCESSKTGIGPASYYSVNGGAAVIGFITPVSSHFCDDCNRLRLTSDGGLKSCLLRPGEVNITELIRTEKNDDKLIELVKKVLAGKERACGKFIENGNFRGMTEIGG